MGAGAAAKALRTLRAGFVAATRIHPNAAKRPDLPEGFLRVVAKAHIVIFRIVDDEAQIVRVVHGTRDIPFLLRQP